MALVSTFALAWFIIGIFVGRQLSAAPAQKSSTIQPRSKRSRSNENGVEVYVGNLSYDVGDKELEKMFQCYGQILSARIIRNKFNGKSKGFGFVEMVNRNEAQTALKAMNGKEMRGRKLVVNEARSKARD
ncbi:MAG: RNA-binding protein [Lentisphaerae bacterium]|nr:RNA-binding protein [Lentisphaerota bacterium]